MIHHGSRLRAPPAHARYSRHRQVARLAGALPDARADLLAQARTFYDTLANRPDLLDPIRGLDRPAVTDAILLVDNAQDAIVAQTAETGEAQRATDTANTAETTLRAHAVELATVAKLALAHKSQLREKLGLLERS